MLLPTSAEFQSWEILHDDFVALLPPTKENAAVDGPLTWEELLSYSRAANKRSTQNNNLVEAQDVSTRVLQTSLQLMAYVPRQFRDNFLRL